MPRPRKADFECLRCGKRFQASPPSGCRTCGSLYLKWLDYESHWAVKTDPKPM